MSGASNSLPFPLPRCCGQHPDWPTLSEHLCRDFPEVQVADVVAEIGRAKDAAGGFGLKDEELLETAELIARQQLMLRSGRLAEGARLDPETHARSTG